MDSVQIGSYLAADSLRRRLFCELDVLRGQGLQIGVRCRSLGDLAVFECAANNGVGRQASEREATMLLRSAVADAVAGLILSDIEHALLAESVRAQHPELSADETSAVCDYAATVMSESVLGMADPALRRVEVSADIQCYLQEYSLLVVEGFVRFRMKEYVEALRASAEEAITRFLADREHREFVRLLKYFVDAQEQREDEVHVVRGADGAFELRDPGGAEIHDDYVSIIAADLMEDGIDMVDLLISALITVSPGRIVLHFRPDPDAAETLASVFGSKVETCHGCRIAGCEMSTDTAGADKVGIHDRRD